MPVALDEFYKTLLSVSGVLFGISFAAMLFVLQSGFSSFKYSRRMFLELYLHFGRQLLYSLAYLTAAPFAVVFFPENYNIISWLYILYLVNFLNATLDYAKEEGYIITLFSHKYVPRQYGRIHSYFRYIKNRGGLRNILYLFPILAFLVYPYVLSVYESWSLVLTKTAVFYSCVISLSYSLFKVTRFIPEFFMYTGMELSSHSQESQQERSEEEKLRNLRENKILKEYLCQNEVTELDGQIPCKFIDGELSVFLDQKDSGEAWFNINIHIFNATPEVIRTEVLRYAHQFAKLLYNSKVEINTFVLSFHISIGKNAPRNILFRFSRNELNNVFIAGRNHPEDMVNISKSVLFDELFRQ